MNNIYVMSLEPLPSRYTGEWLDFIPSLIRKRATDLKRPYNVFNVVGESVSGETTPGAFLNFAGTNIWKNTQMNFIASEFNNGSIKPGDKFVFTDAWNPCIIQLKYMSVLLDIPVEIHSIWHAGSYDNWDLLGQKIKHKTWSFSFERSIYQASDFNYFATRWHFELFYTNALGGMNFYPSKAVIAGFPFNYLKDLFPENDTKKENIILFPHRVSKEKQVDIFKDLAEQLPEYEFVVCQEKNLTKEEYHNLLKRSKMVFSANLQETLGISCWEGMLAGALPLMPRRLSYAEMYHQEFLYPSTWTENYEYYLENRNNLVNLIRDRIERYDSYVEFAKTTEEKAGQFFDGTKLVDKIIKGYEDDTTR